MISDDGYSCLKVNGLCLFGYDCFAFVCAVVTFKVFRLKFSALHIFAYIYVYICIYERVLDLYSYL